MTKIGIWDDLPVALHLEPTKSCNARCPQCIRTLGTTMETMPNLDESQEIDPEWIFDKLKNDFFFSKITTVHLNGNAGDIVMHTNPKKLIEKIFEGGVNKIFLITNGSGLSNDFWSWASKIKNLFIQFAIDGLHDTHRLYRRNTRLDIVLKNLKLFTTGGGLAGVAINVNGNNKDQLEDIKKLAFEHGASKIVVRYNERFTSNYEVCYDKKFKPEYVLWSSEPLDKTDEWKESILSTDFIKSNILKFSKPFKIEKSDQQIPEIVDDIVCDVRTSVEYKPGSILSSFYLSADGRIWPCCFTENDFNTKTLYNKSSSWIDRYYYEMKDPNFNNLHYYTSEEILKLDCFSKLSETWKSNQCMKFCSEQCGKKGKILKRTKPGRHQRQFMERTNE